MEKEFYHIFLDFALILIASKSLGLLMKKLGLPEVVGILLAGILLGPSVLNVVGGSDVLKTFAEVGVVMIMFTAGMETNLKQIKSAGVASVVITIMGVVLPMALGFVVACLFNGGFDAPKEQMISNLYYGTILTATSVSITVATLKELGKLTSKAGTAIITAAILDDIIGLCVLSFIIGLKNTSVSFSRIILNTLLFFVFAIGVGILVNFVFKHLERRYPHNRRMPIFSLAICFLFAFCAEYVFGLAGITGAFIAGVVLSSMKSGKYIEHRVDIGAYLIFAPIFFAGIGINNKFAGFDTSTFLFGLALIAVGMLGKFLGCGAGALLFKFSRKEAAFVGIGMMPRAEVLLITVQKGISNGFIGAAFMPYALLFVIISSLITPILLKLSVRKDALIQTAALTASGS